jgi:hypothetical protein
VRSEAGSPEDYLDGLEPERRAAIGAVRRCILASLPDGYEEAMRWGMISYEVPLSILPRTYNKQPLMYAALASQKRYMSLYLTNVYSKPSLTEWFRERYRATGKRLDMGKSCVRFRSLDDLPLDLVADTVAKTPVDEFIEIYRDSHP